MQSMSVTEADEDRLDSQLAAYSERAARRRARPSTAEVLGYTAAAGGLAFAGGDAVGAIVHNTTGARFSVDSSNMSPQLDLDGAGGADWGLYLFAGYQSGSAFAGLASHFNGGPGSTVATANGDVAINLSPGFVIGPNLVSGVFANGYVEWYENRTGSPNGPIFHSTTGYLGLRFQGDTGVIGTQYAWVKVSFDWESPNLLTMNILEWAYDDSGAPIRVGDTGGAVPTPATALLTLLGLGALGVSAYRRRRAEGLKRLADEQDQAAA